MPETFDGLKIPLWLNPPGTIVPMSNGGGVVMEGGRVFVPSGSALEPEPDDHDALLDAFHDAGLLLPEEYPPVEPLKTGKWTRCRMHRLGTTEDGCAVWFTRGAK